MNVRIFDDDLHEDDETFRLAVDWEGGIIAATGTIFDNDSEPSLSVESVSSAEGETMGFSISLSEATGRATTVEYATGDISAVAGEDYVAASDIAVIPAGELSETVPVRTREDALDEHDETFEFTLSNPVGASFAPGGEVAVGTIFDDDEPPAVSVSNPRADEGQRLVFAVTLDAPSGREATVSYSTSDHTAEAGDDYVGVSGELVFAAGETAKTVSVQSLGDDETEGDEVFFLDLASDDVRFEDNRGAGTIRDVTQRRLSVSDAVAVEGGVLGFVVGFEGPPASRDITVGYETAAGSAEAGADYSDAAESTPRVLRILEGQTSAVALVATQQDSLDEDLEQFGVVLSEPVGAELADREAVGSIIDDDPEPLLSVDDPEAAENGDSIPAVFTLSLSEVSGRDVSVRYETGDLTAKEGDDYVGVDVTDDERATIVAGGRTVQVPVALVDDDVAEEVERFLLVLSDPSNAGFGDSIGAATILDDDAAPQILIDDAAATYEAAGASVSFPVRLSRADPDNEVTVHYATEDATAKAADDYTAKTSMLTFAAGEVEHMVAVALVDDDVAEDTETFRLRLDNPSSNAALGGDGSAVAVILDDDDLPELSVADAPAATEGGTATFTVALSRSSAQAVTFAYAAVTDPFGGDAAAIPGQDFEAVAATVTIPARSTTATVTVPLPDDALDEHAETFWLRLSDPSGATVRDGTGVGTIADNDPLPELSVGDSGATEGDTIAFTVRLTPASGRTVTVPWTTAASLTGDPATPTDDYTAASGTLTFASGTTTARIDIATVDDDVSEPDETFQIQLGQPTNATVDDAAAVGSIIDDDDLPRISIAGTELLETESPAKFDVTLSRTSSQSVSVDYATAADTATAPADYGTPTGEATGTLTIAAGLARGEISVYVADDDLAEPDETFNITLSNPVNAVIAAGAGTAVGTILADTAKPQAGISAAEASEGDGTIEFPVTLSNASAQPVTVQYTTFDGTATQPDDYTATTGTVTIAANQTTATIAVTLTDDQFVENTESFLIRLHNPNGADIDTAEAVGVIFDDDNLPRIAVANPRILESDGFLIWRVTLSHPSDLQVTVDYTSRGWDSDCYGSAPTIEGTLVFEPGSTAHTVTVPVEDDDVACVLIGSSGGNIAWPEQDVNLFLGNPMNAELSRSWIQGQVQDDDGKTLLSIKGRNRGGLLASESDGRLVFDLELGRPFEFDLTVPIRIDETQVLEDLIHPGPGWYDSYVSGPQATAGSDFVARDESVTLPAGDVLVEVSVQIIDDDTVEETEAFMALIPDRRYSNGVFLGWFSYDYFIVFNSPERARITDNDSASVSAEDIEVLESAGTAVFRLQLDRDSTQPVSVQYATVDGTATAPEDYIHTSDTATFDAGTRSVFVEVPVVDDDEEDADETFELLLSAAVGATISDSSATATIRDDDGDDNLSVISIADASATESDHDNFSYLCFLVTTSNHPGVPIAVDFQWLEAPWLGDRAATPGVDYAVPTYGGNTRRLNVHSAEVQACVGVFNDDIPELDEMFIGWLSNPVGAVLGDNMAWGTIIDRDPPIVSVEDATVSESDGFAEFTLTLHEPGVDPATVKYSTVVRASEGDAAATPGDDYVHTSGKLDIAPGVTSATIRVPVIGDSIDEELEETFLLELFEPDRLAFAKSAAVGTITDDDDGWVIDDRSVRESEGPMVFTATRDHTSAAAVTVNYTVTGASAEGGDSCTPGVDYITPPGSVTLQPSETRAEISVTLCDDDAAEGSETLLVQLNGVPGRKLTGVGTIVDDIDDRCINPQSGISPRQLRFTAPEWEHERDANLRFSPRIGEYCAGVVLHIEYRTADGTATAPADYTSVSDSVRVTVGPDTYEVRIPVRVIDDTLAEDDETLLFYVRWGDGMPADWQALPEVETHATIHDED